MERKLWKFTVRGRGNFPFDMLRYDAAFPLDGTGELMGHIFTRPSVCEVNLGTLSFYGPTVDRWRSFGWTVSKSERVK